MDLGELEKMLMEIPYTRRYLAILRLAETLEDWELRELTDYCIRTERFRARNQGRGDVQK